MKSRASAKDAIARPSASGIDLKVRAHPKLITFALIDRNNFVALERSQRISPARFVQRLHPPGSWPRCKAI
jgi:hypothetical protein